jgi:uncharacterized hydrophobic protein (TIGR00271 family)
LARDDGGRVGWFEGVVDPSNEYHKPLPDLEEDLFLHIGATRAKTTKFWVQLALASAIAAGGVIGNSTPAVIGAMIIAPLGTPIYGLALAAVIGERKALRQSLRLLIGGIAVNILIGVLIGLVTVNRMPIDVNPQIIGRTAPTILDLAVAVFTGIAGSFALARRDVADILAGVAIAISLVPVLAVVGITLGAGQFDLALGAFVLFLANAAAILIAGAIVFRAGGYAREAVDRDEKAGHRARIAIIVLVVVLLVPLVASSTQILLYEKYSGEATAATTQWIAGTDWTLEDVTQSSNELVITVIGPGTPPPLEELRTALRAKIPDWVPISLIADSGRTEAL